MVNRSLYAAPLRLRTTFTEATGSGWSVTYECFLFSADLRSHTTTTIYPANGFLFRLKLTNFIQPFYILDYSESSVFPIDSSIEFCHFLPSDLSSLSSVHSFVLSTLSHLGVPSSDPNPLSRLIFSFVQTHRHAATTAIVHLCISFFSTTILRNRSEALDWIHHGTLDSHVVMTLRCTFEALTRLMVEIDESDLLDDESCMVCLEGLIVEEEEEQLLSRLPCSHLFHSGCVSTWLRLDHRCPVCRFPLSWITAISPNELPWVTTTHDYPHFDYVEVEVEDDDDNDNDGDAGNDNENENENENDDDGNEDENEDEDSLVDPSSSQSHSIPLVPLILNKLGFFLNNVVEYMSTSYV